MAGEASGQGAGSPSGVDLSQFECSVCLNLLHDPVVGNCGHDLCRICLDKWRTSEQQRGRAVRCPVCRGVFADTSIDKLGVCVRLRETIAVLFPERSEARRREVDRQQAMEKKRSHPVVVAAGSPSGSPSSGRQPVALHGDGSPNLSRRRVHALRRRSGSASAGGLSPVSMLGSPSGSPLFISAGGQFPASMVAAAASSPAGPGLWGVLQQQLQGAAAMAARGGDGSGSIVSAAGSSSGASQAAWPGESLVNINFTMGWYAAAPRSKRGRTRRLR